jgi:riboflavin kinase/FMN adenylyltransferase
MFLCLEVRIHKGLPGFKDGVHRVVTSGTFDGVHLGHGALLEWVTARAHSKGGESVILTFDPHPRLVLFGDDCGLALIDTLDERLERLAQAGVDHAVVVPFDLEFSRMLPVDYVRNVLVEGVGVGTIVVGHDHRFGAGREGDVALLEECSEAFGFSVEKIPAEIIDQVTVSSTKVRKALQGGDVELAQRLLGRPFVVRGRVVRGAGLGRELGFPTANLKLNTPLKLIPAVGAYTVTARLLDTVNSPGTNSDQTLGGMCNIGRRPTVSEEGTLQIEAHLFLDQPVDLYDRQLELSFHTRLRPEQKFEGRPALVAQLENDRHRALKSLRALGLTIGRALTVALVVLIGTLQPKVLAQTADSIPATWSWDTARVYTNFEQAIARPERVIRLDLTRDKLRELDPRIGRFSQLRELVLDRNKLDALPQELRFVQTLERISVSSNRLESFPQVLLELQGLREIDLSDNEIEDIPLNIDRISRLERLILWGNIIANFPATLSSIDSFTHLDLLHNEMTRVEQEFLKTLLPDVHIELSPPCLCNFENE